MRRCWAEERNAFNASSDSPVSGKWVRWEGFAARENDRTVNSIEQQIANGGPQQTNLSTILRVRNSLMNEIPQGRR